MNQASKNQKEVFVFQNQKIIEIDNGIGKKVYPIKPMCTALGLNWSKQHQMLLKDQFYIQLSTQMDMVAADNKVRKMFCMTAKGVLFWIFGLRPQKANKDIEKVVFELKNRFYNYIVGRSLFEHERLMELDSLKDQVKAVKDLKYDDYLAELEAQKPVLLFDDDTFEVEAIEA